MCINNSVTMSLCGIEVDIASIKVSERRYTYDVNCCNPPEGLYFTFKLSMDAMFKSCHSISENKFFYY